MGGELVESQPASLNSYTEVFNKEFPRFLAYGMTADLYWDDDCTYAKAYREADKLRWEKKNAELWIQGLYIYEALCDVSPVLRAFAKKGTRPQKYRSQPYDLFEKSAEQKEHETEIKEKKIFDKMQSFAQKFNQMFSKKGGE